MHFVNLAFSAAREMDSFSLWSRAAGNEKFTVYQQEPITQLFFTELSKMLLAIN